MGDRQRAVHQPLLGDAVVKRRAFLRSLGRTSAGLALGTGLGWGVGLGLGACASNDQGSSDDAAPRSAGTTRSTPPPPAPNAWDPPDFGPMFRPGTRYRFDQDVGGGDAVVEVHDVGLLHLATGRLVAWDPFSVDMETPAFTVTVPPGDYPVDVSMARLRRRRADPGYPAPAPLGAAARLTIRQGPATSWEMALRPGEDIADLGPREFYGIPVDTGTAAFLDASAVGQWSRRLNRQAWKEDPESAEIDSAIARSEPINVVVDRSTGLNLVIFICGMGDGTYPVWIGRTGSGEPVAYIADLELLSRHASVIRH